MGWCSSSSSSVSMAETGSIGRTSAIAGCYRQLMSAVKLVCSTSGFCDHLRPIRQKQCGVTDGISASALHAANPGAKSLLTEERPQHFQHCSSDRPFEGRDRILVHPAIVKCCSSQVREPKCKQQPIKRASEAREKKLKEQGSEPLHQKGRQTPAPRILD